MTHPAWLGYARTGKEFEVMDKLEALGVEHWRGQRIAFERKGKNRTAEPYTYPALPNYVWFSVPNDRFHLVSAIPHLCSTFIALSPANCATLGRFREAADERLAEAQKAVGNRTAIAAYNQGDELEIRDGAFKGFIARFERMVRLAHEQWPLVEATVTIFGRETTAHFDPLSVARAG